jgi:hypothetical protein
MAATLFDLWQKCLVSATLLFLRLWVRPDVIVKHQIVMFCDHPSVHSPPPWQEGFSVSRSVWLRHLPGVLDNANATVIPQLNHVVALHVRHLKAPKAVLFKPCEYGRDMFWNAAPR